MRTIETVSHIDAPPVIVWEVITDFAASPEWNPFITAIDGEVREGARLRATFRLAGRRQLAGRRPQTFRPTVTDVEPGRRLVWLGHLLVPGLFDGEHGFEVRARGSVRSSTGRSSPVPRSRRRDRYSTPPPAGSNG